MRKTTVLLVLVFTLFALFGCESDNNDNQNFWIFTPSTPTDVVAVAGNGVAVVSWADASQSSVTLFISDNATGEYITYGTFASPPALITGLENGKTYWIKLVATNIFGYSFPSAAISFTPKVPESAPSAIADLAAIASDGKVSLKWSFVPTAESYRILIKESGASEYTPVSNITNNHYIITGLINGKEYQVAVEAMNSVGSNISEAIKVTPKEPLVLPSTPTIFDISTGDSAISIEWTEIQEAVSYVVYLSTVEGDTSKAVAETMDTEIILTSLNNGTPYWVSVASSNSKGVSVAATPIKVTPAIPLVAPKAPINLGAAPSSNSVSLSWNAEKGVNNFKIYMSEASNGTYYYMASTDFNSKIISDLANNKTYYFKVVAVNLVGDSPYSNIAAATPRPAISAPTAPLGMFATPGNASVIVSWANVAGASNYVVYASSSESGTYVPIATVSEPNYVVTGLVNGIASWYKVKASNVTGDSPFSLAVSATPYQPVVPTPPAAVNNFIATSGDSKADLKWDTSPLAESYKVFVKESGATEYTLVANTINNYHELTGLVNGSEYLVAIEAMNYAGSTRSIELTVMPVQPTFPPVSTSFINAIAGDTTINVRWASSPMATSYVVYLSTSEGDITHVIATTPDTQIVLNGLQNGVTYWVTVAGSNSKGLSAIATPIKATPTTPIVAPKAPIGLSATPASNSVALNWQSDDNATNYKVYISRNSEGPFYYIVSTNNNSQAISNLTNDITYYFRVIAINSAGDSDNSSTASATPQPVILPPNAPLGVFALVGNGNVALSWASVATADNYVVYASSSETGGYVPIATLSDTNYTVANLVNGTTSWYKIKASNITGDSPFSSAVNATPFLPLVVSNPPSYLSAMQGDALVSLAWQVSNNATSYNVYMSSTIDGTYSLIKSVDNTSCIVDSLTNGQTYYFKVSAVNNAGEGSQSTPASATPQAVILPPLAPLSLNTIAGNAVVALNWGAVANVDNYVVYFSTSEDGDYLPISTVSATAFVVSNLQNGISYWFKVMASNIAGNSPLSLSATATPNAPRVAPHAPTGISALAGDTMANLAWNPSIYAESYNIYASSSDNGSYVLVASTTSLFYTLINLPNDVTQYYRVTALNPTGESALSNSAAATPKALINPPTAPVAINANAGDSLIELSWAASSGANGYIIYESTDNITFTPDATVINTAYFVTGLINSQTYYYKIIATNSAGTSDFSLVASATPVATITKPIAPYNLAAISGNARATLTWNGVPFANSYNIYVSDSDNGSYSLVASTSGITYVVDNLTNGTTYYYKVAAENSAGESIKSNSSYVTPRAPLIAPEIPLWQQVIPGDSQIVLVWQAVPTADSYIIYRSLDNTTFTTLVATNNLSYRNIALTNGTTYYYKVSAVNNAGEGIKSIARSAAPFGAVVPNAPATVTASPANASATVSWSFVANAVSYNIYMKAGDNGTYSLVGTSVSGLSITLLGLTNDQKYYFKVSAVNTAGESVLSNQATATPQNNNITPTAPTIFVAWVSGINVTLTWSAVPNMDSYSIFMSENQNSGYSLLGTVSTLSFEKKYLDHNKTYYFKIASNKGSLRSDLSDALTVRIN